jgi:large subunit ribosomal protein L14e
MVMEVGRVCIKVAGHEAGKRCVIVETLDNTFVVVSGPGVKRRRCNIAHLEPLDQKIEIAKGAPEEEVRRAFEVAGLVEVEKPVERKPPEVPLERPPEIPPEKPLEEKPPIPPEVEKPAELVPKPEEIESRVLEYIESHGGEIYLTKCAEDLKLPKHVIETAIKSLKEKGRLEAAPEEAPAEPKPQEKPAEKPAEEGPPEERPPEDKPPASGANEKPGEGAA